MPSALEKTIMAEVSGHILFCHDINSVLYTVTNIYPKAGILLKVITVFCSENLALFMVTSIHITQKDKQKPQNKVKSDRKTKAAQGSTG